MIFFVVVDQHVVEFLLCVVLVFCCFIIVYSLSPLSSSLSCFQIALIAKFFFSFVCCSCFLFVVVVFIVFIVYSLPPLLSSSLSCFQIAQCDLLKLLFSIFFSLQKAKILIPEDEDMKAKNFVRKHVPLYDRCVFF